ncbi:MAG: hypothetical protein AAF567_16795 [Actinomycetota bacterium]
MRRRSSGLAQAVVRTRLLDRLAAADAVVYVEAPFGFGKTMLLRQFEQIDDRVALIGSDPTAPDATEAILALLDRSGPESVVVAVDDASERVELVLRLAEHPALRSLILADRLIAPAIVDALDDFESERLGTADLRFDEAEIQRALATSMPHGTPAGIEALSFVLRPASEGWPFAINHMVETVASSSDPQSRARELAYPGPDIQRIVERYLRSIDPQVADAIEIIGHFDAFTGPCINTLIGPQGLQTARAGGAILTVTEGIWYRLPRLVTGVVRTSGELPADMARILAPVMIGSGGLIQGLRTSIEAGCFEDAADTLREIPQSRLDEVDQQALIDVIRSLREVVDQPHLALIQARAHFSMADLGSNVELLRQALDLAEAGLASTGSGSYAAMALEARIELLFSQMHASDIDVLGEARELRRSIDRSVSPGLALRLDEIETMMKVQSSDLLEVAAGVDELRRVAMRWKNLGQRGRASAALRRLAAMPLIHLGRYQEGLEALEDAQPLAWDRLIDRTLTLELTCRFLTVSGRLDGIDQKLKEAWALANATGLPWIKGYLHWCELWLATYRGDATATLRALGHAEREFGPLMAHETGALLKSEAAIALAVLRDLDGAEVQLRGAEQILPEGGLEIEFARSAVAARRGDSIEDLDLIIENLRERHGVPPHRAWRLTADRAIALHRSGDRDGANEQHARSLEQAAAVHQRELAHRLLEPVFGQNGRPPGQLRPLRVNVLGTFEVLHGDDPIEVPQGRISIALKMLALSESPVALDVVLEALWPDCDPEIGRRRIKNVVARLRTLVGADRIVRGEDSLALDPAVQVDLWQFESLIRQSFSLDDPDPTQALNRMVRALESYGGDLLPSDLYDDWIAERRTTARARALSCLDRIFDIEPEHRPSAAWILDVVLRIDANDDRRLLRVARQAMLENHDACARAALDRAVAAADRLGIDVGNEVEDLRFFLSAR